MRSFREWVRRLLGTVGVDRRDEELAEELRAHMELAADSGRRERGAAQAMDALRDQRGLPWLEDLLRDVRIGARMLLRSKGFTATALISLALGIGANAGIFSLFDQVLARPLPVREPERLVQLRWVGNPVNVNYGFGSLVSYPLCRDFAGQRDVFEALACRYPTNVNVSTGGEHVPVRAELVSGSYFQTFGVVPVQGRLIGPDDDREPGLHPVVVLSHDYWTNTLGGGDVVGSRLLINKQPMTVIGIAPETFPGAALERPPAVWIPTMMQPQVTPEINGQSPRAFWIHAIGRLAPDVSVEQARARLQPRFRQILAADMQLEDFPPLNDTQRTRYLASTIDVLPAPRGVPGLRAPLEAPLRVLMAGALLLLVLASLNVAGLQLARGAARTGEVATRMALGASPGRIVRQLLVESVLLTAAGGALGVVTAPLVSGVLRSFVAERTNLNTAIDQRVLLFALAASAATGVLCGLAPVFQSRRLRLTAGLTDRSALDSGSGLWIRKALVAGQLAFALVLTVTAGLFVQTLNGLYVKGPGFDTKNLMMFSLAPDLLGHSYAQAEGVMRETFRRLRELPEIERVAIANSQILNGGSSSGNVTIQAEERRVSDRIAHRMRVTPGFFATLGVSIVAGRDFDERDMRPPGTEPGPYRKAIVNETFAQRYFGARSPLGARIGIGNRPDTEANIEIIGVVREVSRRNLRDQDLDQIFLNFWDNQSENGAFFVRLRASSQSAATAIRSAVAAVDPALPVSLVALDDQIDESLTTERALAALSTGFGVVAVLLAVVGLYGVMAFVAAQRRKEIGLRVALGATRAAAIWLMVRGALAIVGVGLAVAIPAVWGLQQLSDRVAFAVDLVEAQIFGVPAFDPLTIAAAGTALAFVAVTAAAIPAWRASRVDPNAALRTE
jgi:predicted permease